MGGGGWPAPVLGFCGVPFVPCHSESSFAAGDMQISVRCHHGSRGRTASRCLCRVGAATLVLALVGTTLDAFLTLLADTVHTGVLNTILDAALARTDLVTALTRIGTIGTLFARFKSLKAGNT